MTPIPKILSILILTVFWLATFGQSNPTEYLKKNKYSFTIDNGFEKSISDTLIERFKNYRLVLQAEGGSHYLKFYNKLQIKWVTLLAEKLELKNMFLEFGSSAAYCVNKYIETGDSTKLFNSLYLGDKPNIELWRPYFELNNKLKRKVNFFGVDFNRTSSYLKALKLLLPENSVPETIQNSITLIKNGNEKINDCSYIQKINKKIGNDLKMKRQEFQNYFGLDYNKFERIILNKGTCNDERKNRNYNMVDNFLSFDSCTNDKLYYGELGMAHTILKNKVFASILNETGQFKNKVCVINIYCHNCTTPQEKVSNYPLSGIEKDILEFFIPLCNADFTIFDLTGNSTLIGKYKEYGQFLIIAKNQN